MINLYDKQEIAKQEILKKINNNQRLIILSAEVGAGKTYVSVSLVEELSDNKQIFIYAKKHIQNHWKEVLSLAKYNSDNVTLSSKLTDINKKDYDIAIIDEIHELKSQVKHLINTPVILGLSGTLVDKTNQEIISLVDYFGKHIGETEIFTYKMFCSIIRGIYYYEYSRDKSMLNKNLFATTYIKNYICVSLRKTGQSKEDKVVVNTHRVNIPMSFEEEVFYNFAIKRMNNLEVSENRKINILSDFLDRVPEHSKFFIKKYENYYLGEQLVEGDNNKDKELNKILEKHKKGIIVYTFNDELAEQIAENIKNLVYIDTAQPNSVEQINEQLTNTHVVINIDNVLTGITINATTAIFYQTPDSLSKDAQAIGRISRLNSKAINRDVYYLYHNNTVQEKIINKIEQNRKTNNSLIDKTSEDKITMIEGTPVVYTKYNNNVPTTIEVEDDLELFINAAK